MDTRLVSELTAEQLTQIIVTATKGKYDDIRVTVGAASQVAIRPLRDVRRATNVEQGRLQATCTRPHKRRPNHIMDIM